MKDRMNITIDHEAKQQLQIEAVKEERTASGIIEEAVKTYLEKHNG